MNDFTLVDAIVAGVVVLSAVLAYARGLVREALSIAAWIGAAVAAFIFAPALEPLMREVPVLRDIVGTNCELGVLAAFVVVFAVALILFSVFTSLFAGAVQNSALGPVDKGLGFVFGVARGVLLVLIAVLVYEQVLGGTGGIEAVDRSASRAFFAGLQGDLARELPVDGGAAQGWVQARFDTLTRTCRAPAGA